MIRTLASVGCLLAVTPVQAFEPGQRWSCVTDQGADAYLDVIDAEDDSVLFSYGVLDSATNRLTTLCNVRDSLSLKEMKEFCRLLGDEFSDGHVMLRDGCRIAAPE